MNFIDLIMHCTILHHIEREFENLLSYKLNSKSHIALAAFTKLKFLHSTENWPNFPLLIFSIEYMTHNSSLYNPFLVN